MSFTAHGGLRGAVFFAGLAPSQRRLLTHIDVKNSFLHCIALNCIVFALFLAISCVNGAPLSFSLRPRCAQVRRQSVCGPGRKKGRTPKRHPPTVPSCRTVSLQAREACCTARLSQVRASRCLCFRQVRQWRCAQTSCPWLRRASASRLPGCRPCRRS